MLNISDASSDFFLRPAKTRLSLEPALLVEYVPLDGEGGGLCDDGLRGMGRESIWPMEDGREEERGAGVVAPGGERCFVDEEETE